MVYTSQLFKNDTFSLVMINKKKNTHTIFVLLFYIIEM